MSAPGLSKGNSGGKFHHGAKLNARPDHQGDDLWCVMGLAFQGEAQAHLMSLFVVTESQTLSFNMQTTAKVGPGLKDATGVHDVVICEALVC